MKFHDMLIGSHKFATQNAKLSLWFASIGNIVFWQKLWSIPGLGLWATSKASLAIFLILFAALMLLLSLLSWRYIWQVVVVTLLLSSAASTYFMQQYGVVIDQSMMANAFQTDLNEVRALLNWQMLLYLLLFGLLPIVWFCRKPILRQRFVAQLVQNALWAGVSLLFMLGVLWWAFQDLSSLMRNDKSLRYSISPFNTINGLVVNAKRRVQPERQGPLTVIGEDAKLGSSYAGNAPAPILVIVLGETARAANFSLGGYARQTNPQLEGLRDRENLVYYRDVSSCGTNTEVSVPCIFSRLTREQGGNQNPHEEGLLDVLHRAGLAVLWLDNQSGCKGVCDRVAYVNLRELGNPKWCSDGECLDEILLDGLDQRIAALPAERRAKGVVVVMHQMGSHGPEYFRRSPAALKVFKPECTNNALPECSRDSIVNAYDNSIHYTDHFLHQVWQWLNKQSGSTAMLYVSDHGESLGENNLYLHGMPYAIAPKEQTHVPMLSWVSPAMQKRLAIQPNCLKQQADASLSHDNVFSTVLGLLDVQTLAYTPSLDMFRNCKPAPQ